MSGFSGATPEPCLTVCRCLASSVHDNDVICRAGRQQRFYVRAQQVQGIRLLGPIFMDIVSTGDGPIDVIEHAGNDEPGHLEPTHQRCGRAAKIVRR